MSKNLLSQKVSPFMVPTAFARVTVLLLLVFFSQRAFSQATLIKDIVTQGDVWSNDYTHLVNGDGVLYFSTAWQLWKSDGTIPGTVKLNDVKFLRSPVWAGNTLYFTAEDDSNGRELWKSDGTAEGTAIVKDIYAGSVGSHPSDLTVVKGVLYFSANDGIHGKELWKSDGTAAGTSVVKDIIRVRGSSNPSWLTHVNGTLFFSANDAQHGYELWKSDGTEAGTVMVKDLNPGTGSTPHNLTAVEETLFFVATDGAGKELWRSDGTATGTFRAKDIWPGAKHSNIANMTAVDNMLFFTANDGVHGDELWKSNGTAEGTLLVLDMTPGKPGSNGEGPFTSNMGSFTSINGMLYFCANQDDSFYMWRSDGTAEGTVPFRMAIGPGISDPQPQFTYMDGSIFYFNDEENYALYRMNLDGSNPERLIGFVFVDYYNGYYPGIVVVGNTLYVTGRPAVGAVEDNFTIIKSDGTREGTAPFFDADKSTIGSNPNTMVSFNNKVYFTTSIEEYPYNDYEKSALWETDGTAEGTQQRFEVENATMVKAQDALYITGRSGNTGVWKLDKTGSLTMLRRFIYSPRIPKMVTVGNTLYFYTDPFTEGGEIWRSDGTPEGTFPLMAADNILSFAATATGIMFQIISRNGDEELWKSGGTAATTTKVKTIRSGPGATSRFYPTAVMNDILYFVANDGIHGNEIWRSDGTAAGTYMALNVNGNDKVEYDNKEYDLRTMAVFKNRIYFGARQIILGSSDEWSLRSYEGTGMSHGILGETDPISAIIPDVDKLYFVSEKPGGPDELWVYPQGQPLLRLAALEGSAFQGFAHEIVNGVMYYSTMFGTGLWRTDGTVCGTSMIQTGTSGAYPMAALPDNTLVFGSATPEYGKEPFAFDLSLDPGNPCEPVGDCSASGTITREYWTGVQGSRVSDIPLNSPPTGSHALTIFEGPSFDGSHYGARIRGYVCPPSSGNYTFYISSNDHSELWLSDGEDPANKVRIAYVSGATGLRQWDKYASQRSVTIPLIKAKKYYVEVLHKQGVGTDHVAVGWALPDGTLERPIPGHRLSPLEGLATPSAAREGIATSTDEEKFAQISVYPNPAVSGDPSLTISGYAGIEESVETDIQIVNLTGEVIFSDKISCGGTCDAYIMNVNKALVPGIYLVQMKTNGKPFSRRLIVK